MDCDLSMIWNIGLYRGEDEVICVTSNSSFSRTMISGNSSDACEDEADPQI